MRTKKEIVKAIERIKKHPELTYGYKYDVISVLEWVLGGEPFDGIDEEEEGEIKKKESGSRNGGS